MLLVVYYLYPQQLGIPILLRKLLKEKLDAMGKISLHEIIMMAVFVILIALWINGSKFGLSPTTVALTWFIYFCS